METSKWLSPGFLATYRFMRVSRSTWREVGVVHRMVEDTLSIARDIDRKTKESGSVEYVGRLDIGSDYLRVYLDASFHDGSVESVPLGTFMVSAPTRRADWSASGGVAELDGLLKVADDAQYERPVTAEAGCDAVEKAAEVLRSCGLNVIAEPSPYRLGAARTYSFEGSGVSSKLDMANDLLSLASFREAWTDGNGTVHLTPDREGSGSAPIWEFAEGENARFLSEVTEERDISSVKNLVRVTYSTQEKSFLGIARDDSPESEFSTVSLGRVVSMTERLSDVPDEATDQQIQDLADAKALEVLHGSQSVAHVVKLSSAHCPVWYGDRVAFHYPDAGISGKFTVASMSVRDIHGALAEITIRRYER